MGTWDMWSRGHQKRWCKPNLAPPMMYCISSQCTVEKNLVPEKPGKDKTITVQCFGVKSILDTMISLSSAFKNPFSWEKHLTSVEIYLFLNSCSLLCPSYVILFSWFAYRSVTCDVLVLWANGSVSAVMNGSPYAFNSGITKA